MPERLFCPEGSDEFIYEVKALRLRYMLSIFENERREFIEQLKRDDYDLYDEDYMDTMNDEERLKRTHVKTVRFDGKHYQVVLEDKNMVECGQVEWSVWNSMSEKERFNQ